MSRTITITAEQEAQQILHELRAKIDRSDKKIKEWVVEVAEKLEENKSIPTNMISEAITTALKGTTISMIYVRSCLEQKYKNPTRVANSKKRIAVSKKKINFGNGHFAKIQKYNTDKLQEIETSPLSKITKQQIRKETDVKILRDIALFQFTRADMYKLVSETAARRVQHLEEELGKEPTPMPQLLE